MIRGLVRLLWRLLPVAIGLYALRDGAESGRQVAKQVTNVVRQAQAYIALQGAAKSLTMDFMNNNGPPTNFTVYLKKNLSSKSGDPSIDPWGKEYGIRITKRNVTIYSCGPDKRCYTKDDLKLDVPRNM